jgi:hypothetical protein
LFLFSTPYAPRHSLYRLFLSPAAVIPAAPLLNRSFLSLVGLLPTASLTELLVSFFRRRPARGAAC